ncbi:hypothetical protein L915_21836 [Phytophthora nicotianae]|uniref:Uncharacterized protein n=2 Tax=Phytophthora nicotianae TaxID=4792 RepID=W2Q5E9_PHYN3|nr:hypothetical protein PPTG_23012 [Phytophthora nicotianae INRA-310]ETK70836.1 hypothetical protein L915_21836 [Phytophthora nicotianae]ETL24378.1 hypothetical protein L916_21608 [Phytophthora nicotianae]ETN08408.1 hypothetical protein PPTG_23012 [Phytophthora nicotianae INRA-310]
MALVMIDIARCNAYVCHQLASNPDLTGEKDLIEADWAGFGRGRDNHLSFVAALVREMFNGSWKEGLINSDGMLYADTIATPNTTSASASITSCAEVTSCVATECVARESWYAKDGVERSVNVPCVALKEGRRHKKTIIARCTKLLCASEFTR